MPSPLAAGIAQLPALLTPDVAALLESRGYCVIDNALPLHTARALRAEILACHEHGLLDSNHTAYVESAPAASSAPVITRLLSKPHIYEAEVLPQLLCAPSLPLPHLSALSSAFLPHLEARLSSLLPHLLLYSGHSSIKLQLNTRHGAFPFHYDSPGGLHDTRRVTALLYLNPDWKAADGGRLVLQPWLAQAAAVAPVMNRLLLFRSDRLLHRVETSNAERVCLTFWLHGRAVDPPLPSLPSSAAASLSASSLLSLLSHPSYQRSLSKCLYQEEWLASYRAAHTPADAELLCHSLSQDVQRLLSHPQVLQLVSLMREMTAATRQQEVRSIDWKQGDVCGAETEEPEQEQKQQHSPAIRPLPLSDSLDSLDFLDYL